MTLRLKRGLNTDRNDIVFEEGEIIWATDTRQLYVGDGVTEGGNLINAQVVDSDWVLNLFNLTDSDWILRQIPTQNDSDWILRQVNSIQTDSDWITRQILPIEADVSYLMSKRVDSEWVVSTINRIQFDSDAFNEAVLLQLGTSLSGLVDSDWILRQIPTALDSEWILSQIPTQNDSEWILRQINNIEFDSEWTLRQINNIEADSDWTLRQIDAIPFDSDWTLRQIDAIPFDSDWTVRQISKQISEIKFDSDWVISELRHVDNFKTFTYAPTVDVPSGGTFNTNVTISDYPDIDVFLNGVLVTQYTTATTLFTFNFVLRANTDVVIIKMRK